MSSVAWATVDAVLEDWRTAPIPERLRATLTYLEALTLRPTEVKPIAVALNEALTRLEESEAAGAEVAVQAAEDTAASSRTLILAVLGLGLTLAVALGWLVAQLVIRPVTAVRDGITRLAEIAFSVNERTENIGARRLSTVMERLLDEISFEAAHRSGETVHIDGAYVDARLQALSQDEDLSRFIL